VVGPIAARTKLVLAHITTMTASRPVNTYNPIGLWLDRVVEFAGKRGAYIRGDGCVSCDCQRAAVGLELQGESFWVMRAFKLPVR
jgi:hypothetical protein